MAHDIHFSGITIPVWIYAPVFFCLWIGILYSIKAVVFARLRAWAAKTPGDWDDYLVASLTLPVNILILSGGLAFLENLLPLPKDVDRTMLIAVKVLAILALFLFFDRMIMRVLRHFSGQVRGLNLSEGLIPGLTRCVVLCFGLMILLDALGISITPFVASLGVGSLAVALGLQETLVNLFAGIYILADRPVRVGDFVRLETGEEGYVTDIGWRNTRIRLPLNVVVVVPNNKIISTTIHNYYLPDQEIVLTVSVGVHYQSDLEKVERVTREVALETQKKAPGAVETFEPAVRFQSFDASSINTSVVLRARHFEDQPGVKHYFIKALHARYQQEGIVIAYPTQTLDIPQNLLEQIGRVSQDRK